VEILLDTVGNLQEALDAQGLHGDFEIDRYDPPLSLSTVDRIGERNSGIYHKSQSNYYNFMKY